MYNFDGEAYARVYLAKGHFADGFLVVGDEVRISGNDNKYTILSVDVRGTFFDVTLQHRTITLSNFGENGDVYVVEDNAVVARYGTGNSTTARTTLF